MTSKTHSHPNTRQGDQPGICKKAMRSTAIPLAFLFTLAQVGPAYATMDNTVTASGTGPGGVPVTANASEIVTVDPANPQISISKTTAFPVSGDTDGDTLADPGETIAYTYTVTNTGNVTLSNVTMNDVHDGTGTLVNGAFPVTFTDGGSAGGSSDDAADSDWDLLGPGDAIVFTASYVVVAGDITAAASADGDIDNTATASGSFGANPPVTANSSVAIPIDAAPSMTIAKVADDDTNVTVGQVITYTYTVTNTGNVPITTINLVDNHNGSGPDPVPAFSSWSPQNGSSVTGNTIDQLNPGAVAIFTATYTVTQSDIDTLQ